MTGLPWAFSYFALLDTAKVAEVAMAPIRLETREVTFAMSLILPRI